MKRLIPLLASGLMAIFSLLACSGESYAQEDAGAWPSRSIPPRHITMDIGRSIIVDLPRDAAEIFVANPKVANALVLSPRKLYLIAMDRGQTTVYALDHEGRRMLNTSWTSTPFMLRTVMPGAAITARLANGTIILIGTVDSAEDAQRAVDLAKAYLMPTPAVGLPGTSSSPAAPPAGNSTLSRSMARSHRISPESRPCPRSRRPCYRRIIRTTL
jgi:pilus assembly protein CpaC